MPHVRDLNGGKRRIVPNVSYHMMRPPAHPSIYGRCDVVIFVARDYSHVLIGGGEFGYDGLAREVDAVELRALAGRFPLPELQRAAAAERK